jgi:cyclic beta-1,2-glucan synthetase
VGAQGRGESVWLGWFLAATLRAFTPLAEARGDVERARICREQVDRLAAALDAAGWDGEWYRRAYFDDGTPLGSRENDECRIDAIAQSWAVIAGVGDVQRARQAMRAAEEHLIRREDRLILLFTPPFERTALDPGYVKAYPAGVRENGGQYTHGALWTVLATALLGDGERALELFHLLNPITHALTPEEVARYRVEPYVVAADVYSAPGHVGRGGWTWYTGSAAWMYRVGLEAILGLRRRGDALGVDPCIPAAWPGYEIAYRYRSSCYQIAVENPARVGRGVARVELDGEVVSSGWVPLRDDGAEHRVRVVLGPPAR